MARIEGVDLPREKRIEIGLRYIYGIGPTQANEILEATGVNPDIRVMTCRKLMFSSANISLKLYGRG